MKRTVLKYGGSSVSTIDKMYAIADEIIYRKNSGEDLVVVVSAMGKTTNELLSLAKSAVRNPNRREIDMLISTGEQVAIALLSMILNDKGCPAISLTGFQAGIKTEGNYTKNRITRINLKNIISYLNQNKVIIVAGFQGINKIGDITTLGRGGSDTTAVSLAAKLRWPCEIYTDVDGVYTIDPKVYPKAKKIDKIGYPEMKELAYLGAKVMEPRSIEIGEKFSVPIYVASSTNKVKGTYIMKGDTMEKRTITGLSIYDKIVMVTLKNMPNDPNFLSEVLLRFTDNELNIEMANRNVIKDNYYDFSFLITTDDLHQVTDVIEEITKKYLGMNIEINLEIVKISIIGKGISNNLEVISKLLKVFSKNNIEFYSFKTSEYSISLIIDKINKQKVVEKIALSLGL